jgi:protein-tyrosine phosphatase
MRQAVGVPNIVFVCLGNICRSPFAEALLRARVDGGSIEVASAGTLPQPGRPIPAFGLSVATTHGVDLSAHRSAWLTRRVAEDASLLIVFDETTRGAVLDRYPDLRVPIIRLGDVAGLGDIADPIDGGLSEFAQSYELIATAIAELERLFYRDGSPPWRKPAPYDAWTRHPKTNSGAEKTAP